MLSLPADEATRKSPVDRQRAPSPSAAVSPSRNTELFIHRRLLVPAAYEKLPRMLPLWHARESRYSVAVAVCIRGHSA